MRDIGARRPPFRASCVAIVDDVDDDVVVDDVDDFAAIVVGVALSGAGAGARRRLDANVLADATVVVVDVDEDDDVRARATTPPRCANTIRIKNRETLDRIRTAK